MKLIDADKLIECINAKHVEGESEISFSEQDVKTMIEEQETIYPKSNIPRAKSQDRRTVGRTIEERNADALSIASGNETVEQVKERRFKDELPRRIKYVKDLLERMGISYELKNEETGLFYCYRKSDGKMFEFKADTGEGIVADKKMRIHNFVMILIR